MTSLKTLAAGLFAAASMALAAPAAAQSDAAFFKGKTIKLVVGFGVGGGYDAYARMLAGPIGQRLGATIVVENQPGAGGVNALNRIYAAKGDALQMMIVNGTAAALSQIVEQSGVRYDLAQVSVLGTIAASPWVWLVPKDSPINSPQDAVSQGREIRWAAGGPIDGLSDGAWFTCEALKLKCNVVIGYKGSADAARAVMQGEMDAIYVSDTSALAYTGTGNVKPITVMNRRQSRFFPNVKPIFEMTKIDANGAWLIDFHSALEDLGRILVAPPGVAPGQLKVLQDAVMATLTDKEMVALGEKTRRYIEPLDPVKTLANVRKVVSEPTAEERKRLRAVMRLDKR